MNNQTKVLLVASECAPIVKIGELGDFIYNLPKELIDIGFDARVILPLYKAIDAKKFDIKPIWRDKKLKIRKDKHNIGLWCGTLPGSKAIIYFIENKKHFGTGSVSFAEPVSAKARIRKYGVKVNHRKEIERYAFFSDAVFTLLKEKLLPFEPDIVHAHDWHSGLLIKQIYDRNQEIIKLNKRQKKVTKTNEPTLASIGNPLRTVLTIHNLSNQGIGNSKNFLKDGILNADVVTTVSATYAEEIKNKENGFGLHSLLKKRQPQGILNGFNYENLRFFGEKDLYKLEFQEANGLKKGIAFPMFAMVGPFQEHKGIHSVISVISYAISLFDAQFVFLGSGEDEFEKTLTKMAKKFPENIKVILSNDEELAPSVYAATDFSLLPSSYEPCGSGQMLAMSYGALPIARATGGLKETIKDGKTGFIFEEKNEKGLLKTILRSLEVFSDEESFNHMRELAISEDFSWEKPLNEYAKIYRDLMKDHTTKA